MCSGSLRVAFEAPRWSNPEGGIHTYRAALSEGEVGLTALSPAITAYRPFECWRGGVLKRNIQVRACCGVQQDHAERLEAPVGNQARTLDELAGNIQQAAALQLEAKVSRGWAWEPNPRYSLLARLL
jgi:hypothetical protein